MNPVAIGAVVFVCVLSAAVAGVLLRGALPAAHLNSQSRDVVKLVAGMIATVAAMVLGLLVASAKTSYDTTQDQFRQGAAQVIMLDRVLADYGPETKAMRGMLRDGYRSAIDQVFSQADGVRDWLSAPGKDSMEVLEHSIRALAPSDELRRGLQARALQLIAELSRTRWLLVAESGSSLSPALLVVLVSWLAAIFLAFGLLAPRNPTTLVAMVIGAMSVATAVFIIEELDRPLTGVLRLSPEPLKKVVEVVGR